MARKTSLQQKVNNMQLDEVEKINNLAKQLKAHHLAANINEAIQMATDIMRREKKSSLQQEAKKAVRQEPDLLVGKRVLIKEPVQEVETLFDEGKKSEPAETTAEIKDEPIEEITDEEIIDEKKIDLEEDAEEILGEDEASAKKELMAQEAHEYDVTQEDKTIAELLSEEKPEIPPAEENNTEEIKHGIEEDIMQVKAQEEAEPKEEYIEMPANFIDEKAIEELKKELAEETVKEKNEEQPEQPAEEETSYLPIEELKADLPEEFAEEEAVPIEEIKADLPEELVEEKSESVIEKELHEEQREEEEKPPKPKEEDIWVDWTEDYKGKKP